MRVKGILALALAAATAGAPRAGPAAEPVHFTPDEAVLACLARAEREVTRRHGPGARLAGPFQPVRLHGGWRVYGVYRLGGGGELRVACDIAAGRVELVAQPAAE